METSRGIAKEGEDPLETYNGSPTEWIDESEEYIYYPESEDYLTQDAFCKDPTKEYRAILTEFPKNCPDGVRKGGYQFRMGGSAGVFGDFANLREFAELMKSYGL